MKRVAKGRPDAEPGVSERPFCPPAGRSRSPTEDAVDRSRPVVLAEAVPAEESLGNPDLRAPPATAKGRERHAGEAVPVAEPDRSPQVVARASGRLERAVRSHLVAETPTTRENELGERLAPSPGDVVPPCRVVAEKAGSVVVIVAEVRPLRGGANAPAAADEDEPVLAEDERVGDVAKTPLLLVKPLDRADARRALLVACALVPVRGRIVDREPADAGSG